MIDELELVGGQAANRIAVAVDDRHRHFNQIDVDRFPNLGQGEVCGKKDEARYGDERAHEDILPDCARMHEWAVAFLLLLVKC